MKKLHKSFIVCLIYLSFAIFLSLIYLLAGLNGQLAQTEETMSPLTSVIVFSCFLIVPPLIWLVYLIITKRVFFNIQIEQKRINKKLKYLTIICTKKDDLEKNTKLIKILKNYTQNNYVALNCLEFSFVPLRKIELYGRNEFLYQTTTKGIELCNINSEYISQIKLYTKKILNSHMDKVEIGYEFFDNNFKTMEPQNPKIHNALNKINELYNLLMSQKIIENSDANQYRAFLYLVYKYKKINMYLDAKNTLENIGLSIESKKEDIITTMFNNDLDNNTIVNALYAIESNKNNYIDLFCENCNNIFSEVDALINDLKEKQKLHNLLSDKNEFRYDISDIDLMSGAEFEEFITYLFSQLGYKATNTKLSGDQGVDVIATKGKTKVAIQCKCFSGSVGNHAIMEAYAGARYYNADKVMVVTNSTFTKSARELAQSNNVVLWDRKILKEKLEEI